jgi:hypothetical protein
LITLTNNRKKLVQSLLTAAVLLTGRLLPAGALDGQFTRSLVDAVAESGLTDIPADLPPEAPLTSDIRESTQSFSEIDTRGETDIQSHTMNAPPISATAAPALLDDVLPQLTRKGDLLEEDAEMINGNSVTHKAAPLRGYVSDDTKDARTRLANADKKFWQELQAQRTKEEKDSKHLHSGFLEFIRDGQFFGNPVLIRLDPPFETDAAKRLEEALKKVSEVQQNFSSLEDSLAQTDSPKNVPVPQVVRENEQVSVSGKYDQKDVQLNVNTNRTTTTGGSDQASQNGASKAATPEQNYAASIKKFAQARTAFDQAYEKDVEDSFDKANEALLDSYDNYKKSAAILANNYPNQLAALWTQYQSELDPLFDTYSKLTLCSEAKDWNIAENALNKKLQKDDLSPATTISAGPTVLTDLRRQSQLDALAAGNNYLNDLDHSSPPVDRIHHAIDLDKQIQLLGQLSKRPDDNGDNEVFEESKAVKKQVDAAKQKYQAVITSNSRASDQEREFAAHELDVALAEYNRLRLKDEAVNGKQTANIATERRLAASRQALGDTLSDLHASRTDLYSSHLGRLTELVQLRTAQRNLARERANQRINPERIQALQNEIARHRRALKEIGTVTYLVVLNYNIPAVKPGIFPPEYLYARLTMQCMLRSADHNSKSNIGQLVQNADPQALQNELHYEPIRLNSLYPTNKLLQSQKDNTQTWDLKADPSWNGFSAGSAEYISRDDLKYNVSFPKVVGLGAETGALEWTYYPAKAQRIIFGNQAAFAVITVPAEVSDAVLQLNAILKYQYKYLKVVPADRDAQFVTSYAALPAALHTDRQIDLFRRTYLRTLKTDDQRAIERILHRDDPVTLFPPPDKQNADTTSDDQSDDSGTSTPSPSGGGSTKTKSAATAKAPAKKPTKGKSS